MNISVKHVLWLVMTSHRQPFHSRTCHATAPGEIIRADVCGPME